MASRRTRAKSSLAQQAAELALAVPQVVAHRMTRMALAGPHPSPRDRKEFARMVAEKNAAFGEAWQAMALHGARAQQALGASLFASFLAMAHGRRPSPGFSTTSSSSPAGCVTRIERAPKRSWMPVWQTR